ncbi:MAG TPA: twin transmembrane helix small protein [Rhabdaerophilum sp.]|nr:twin transmembrane helix small protein [Rhabdaerophilum sp.]
MNAVVGVAVGAVSLVLLAGLFNMLKGGNPNRSQQLMRWRVILQFLAVILIMAVIWYRGD